MFTGMRAGHFDAYMLRPDEGVVRSVIEEPGDQNPAAVLPDGRIVLFGPLHQEEHQPRSHRRAVHEDERRQVR